MIEETFAWFQQQIQHNDVFAGLVGGSAVASGIYALRSVPKHLWRLFLLQGTAHMVVYNDDEVFEWLNQWLAAHPYAKRARRMKLSSHWRSLEDGGTTGDMVWALAPGPGAHLFWHRGKPVWLRRAVETGEGSAGSHRRKETIEIRMLGRTARGIRALISEAREMQSGGDRIEVYTHQGQGWRRVARKRPRDLDTVVLPQAQIANLVADATWFFGAINWYRQRGVPYRRGYLLHGPPGCGKTSLVMGLASHFQRPIYALSLSSVWSDDHLLQAIADVPAAAILLIEDIDAASASKARRAPKMTPRELPGSVGGIEDPKPEHEGDDRGITLSGLLNAIDGVASAEGRLLVMTTNHRERLDAALIRPGRVDRQEQIGPLDVEDAHRLFLRFFDDEQAADALAAGYGDPRAAAELQGLFLLHSDDPWRAVAAAVADEQQEAAE